MCTAAHSGDVGQRARERLAMLQFDEVVVAEFFASLKTGEPQAADRLGVLKNVLAELERTVLAAAGSDSLLGFHCGVHWARMRWIGEESHAPMLAIVADRPRLRAWLDEAADLSDITATLPEKAPFVALMRQRFGQGA